MSPLAESHLQQTAARHTTFILVLPVFLFPVCFLITAHAQGKTIPDPSVVLYVLSLAVWSTQDKTPMFYYSIRDHVLTKKTAKGLNFPLNLSKT